MICMAGSVTKVTLPGDSRVDWTRCKEELQCRVICGVIRPADPRAGGLRDQVNLSPVSTPDTDPLTDR